MKSIFTFGMTPGQFPRQLVSPHTGHDQVGEHKIDFAPVFVAKLQGKFPSFRLQHLIAQLLQALPDIACG